MKNIKRKRVRVVELNHKRILVTFLMHLGDLTLTTPFIRALREAAPDSHIAMLVDEKLKDVVLHNPCLDEVITLDKKGRDNSVLALLRCARSLGKMHFDLLINLHPNERCSFICAMTKAGIRTGCTNWLFRPWFHVLTPLDRTKHAADMYLDVLRQLGVNPLNHQGLEIFPGPEDREEAERFWQEQHVAAGETLVGFNIGSAVETKRWAPERFAEVADTLAAAGCRPVFFGGPMDEAMVQEAVGYMRQPAVVATGRFTIGQLAAAMRRCSLIVTNDSGPMHVAISQRVPVVAMYGPSHPDLYGPYTERATIVTAIPPCPGCAAGMRHHCTDPRYDMRCMKELTVQQVLEACRQWLPCGSGSAAQEENKNSAKGGI